MAATTMKPLTRKELDALTEGQCPCGCGKPYSRDNQLSLAAKCHFPTSFKFGYWEGVLTLECAECGQPVCKIAVQE